MAEDTNIIGCYRCGKGSQDPAPAVRFIRIPQTNRLCPLCQKCYDNYMNAVESLKSRSGFVAGTPVELEEGAEEFRNQPSREEFDRQQKSASKTVEAVSSESSESEDLSDSDDSSEEAEDTDD